MFDKPRSKNIAYRLNDNFYTFWFRFIARHAYMLEIGAHDQLKELIKRDYEQFTGKMLERYFQDRLAESKKFTRLGAWWDRTGENEIDIIAENELEKTVKFFEVKRNAARIEMESLKSKAAAMLRATGEFKDYGISYEGLSLENIRKGT